MECKICGTECADKFTVNQCSETRYDGEIIESWQLIERCPNNCGLYINYICQTSYIYQDVDDKPIVECVGTEWVINDPETTDYDRVHQHYFDEN